MLSAKELIAEICDATGGVDRQGTSDWEWECKKKLMAARRRKRYKGGSPENEYTVFGTAGLPGGGTRSSDYYEEVDEGRLDRVVTAIWKDLPSAIQGRLGIDQLHDFLIGLENGTLRSAAAMADLPLPVATSLLRFVGDVL